MSGYYLPFDRSIRRSQDYGANPNNGINPPGGHNGDDWATPIGTPVRAAGDGQIVHAGQFDDTYWDNFGWNLNMGGLMVILNTDGDAGPYFEYGHLSKVLVSPGQRVRAGDIIALTGNSDGGTGVSTGPHCHVGSLPPNFWLGSSTYGRVNPRIYMTEYWDGATLAPQSTTITEQDDEMSAQEVKQILDFVQAAHDVTRGYVVDQSQKQHEATRNLSQAMHDVTRAYLADKTIDVEEETRRVLAEKISAVATDPQTIISMIPEEVAQAVLMGLGQRLAAKDVPANG